MNLQKIYEYALQREEEGYQFFKRNAEEASHGAAIEIFEKLANEELKHIQYIKELINTPEEEAGPTNTPLEKDSWFEDRAGRELLDQSLIESMIPDIAVLRTAYLIEHDLSEFYEMAAKNSSGVAQLAFSQLAAWERGHEAFFKELHDRIFQEYTEMPWGG
ncbi:ferritin-like domain-containing protein [Desulfopila inferna]|uniref:ferritin-like domain-containing protein n=1 Tax=Desulfopila inferna TaxID=468528 RepID=UPI0019626405|nr:ferritin family protein [Desulfopila inferna]MBM9606501.1 ferritin family protein [Desulfopila inferna]